MRLLIGGLVLLFLVLQYQLWLSPDGFPAVWEMREKLEAQKEANERLRERNAALEAEVRDLKTGLDAIEERARSELGMVGRDETFYQVVDP